MLRYFDQDVFRLGQHGPCGPFDQAGFELVVRGELVGLLSLIHISEPTRPKR